MGRGNRLAFVRFASAIGIAAAMGVGVGCSAILGITDGTPYPPEASSDDAPARDDGMSADGGADVSGGGDGDATAVDSGVDSADSAMQGDDVSETDAPDAPGEDATDAPANDAPAEACTPDLTFCQNRCKPGTDSCGVMWNCTGTCAPGEGCAPDGTCICVSDPNWCNNRCGMTTDNCGRMINCPGCAGGLACTNGACGCTAESTTMACGSNQCNSVQNNCMQTVNCGVNGTTLCPSGQQCDTSASPFTCCTLGTCAGRCNAMISDNCGGHLTCPSNGCPAGQVCDLATTDCCTQVNNCGNSCGGSASDGCGNQVSCSCSSPDVCYGGTCCTPDPTAACTSNCHGNCGQYLMSCCGGTDGGGAEEAPACVPSGGLCNVAVPCCSTGTVCAPFEPYFLVMGGGGPGPDSMPPFDSSMPPMDSSMPPIDSGPARCP
jgi:hypothetical protein